MKNIIIIDTYPSNITQEKILVECIEKLKPMGYDIMVVSHFPINSEIQKMVNYVLFDDKNTFLPGNMSPHYYLNTDRFGVKVYNGGHSLPITRNMSISLNMCKSLGYEFFYFMEFDVLFGEQDLDVLAGLKNQMVNEEKKMIFFKPIDFFECGSHVYETLLFGGNVDFFLEKFQPPIDIDDWVNKKMGFTLELAVFEKFSEFEDQYVIIPDHSHNFFTNSRVNVFRYGLFVCELLYNISNEDLPTLLINSHHSVPNDKHVKVMYGDHELLNRKFERNQWWFHQFTFDNNEILIYIYEDEENSENMTIKRFKLDKSLIENYKNRGTINFNF